MNELAKILKGSQNYSLAGPDSDEDFITIVTPSLVELYFNKTFNTNNEHLSFWTLPLFTKRFLSADPTALELCFSCKAEYYDEDFNQLMLYCRQLCEQGFLCSVWPEYCNRMFGLMHSDLKNAERTDWETKRRLKLVSRVLYFLDLVECIVANNGDLTEETYRKQIGDTLPYEIKFHHTEANLLEDIAAVRQLIDARQPVIKSYLWMTNENHPLVLESRAIEIMRKYI